MLANWQSDLLAGEDKEFDEQKRETEKEFTTCFSQRRV
jgi:hypothetical protein